VRARIEERLRDCGWAASSSSGSRNARFSWRAQGRRART